MKKVAPILVALLGICVVLFILVPLAYVALGRMSNPFEINPNTLPAYGAGNNPNQLTPGALLSGKTNKPINTCMGPVESLETHVRDAKLSRDDEESIISSEFYKININLEEPIVDWQYTNGALSDEVASFVYKDVIVNTMARISKPECASKSAEVYKNFHTKNQAIEYFSSPTYIKLGASVGLTSAVLRTYGTSSIEDRDYYWYILDEQFNSLSDKPVVTIWYSTRVGRIEYWFAFRTFQANEDNLNSIAEEVLESTEYLRF